MLSTAAQENSSVYNCKCCTWSTLAGSQRWRSSHVQAASRVKSQVTFPRDVLAPLPLLFLSAMALCCAGAASWTLSVVPFPAGMP